MRGHDEARQWDAFYAGTGDGAPHWSGEPNPALVAEVSALRPGAALDVGCGEGADAIWLARRGWEVTAIDPARVALDRAATAARAAGVDVTWRLGGLLDLAGERRSHDLVSALYPVLDRADGEAAIGALIRAVSPGGTLVFVHHEQQPDHAVRHGSEAASLVMPGDVAANLDDAWDVEVLEARPRPRSRPGPQVRDIVLRARRRG